MSNHTQDPETSKTGRRKFRRINVFLIYTLLLLGLLGVNFFYSSSDPVESSWQRVQQMLDSGHVSRLVGIRNRLFVEVYLTPEGFEAQNRHFSDGRKYDAAEPFFTFTVGSFVSFEQQLVEGQKGKPIDQQVFPTYEDRPDYFSGFLTWILPFLLIIGLWVFIFRRMGRNAGGGAGSNIFNIGRSRAQLFNKEENIKVDFRDVAGLEEAKVEIREIVDFLMNPEKYTELGGKIPKGALLVGPPGTGKTLLAKAVAGEANVPFFSLSGSDFVEMFVGVGASRVRDLFKQAKEKAPCIIFIDEIDAIGRSRARNASFGGGAEERENTLNQLLTEMDGFSTNQGVIVLAATNRADVLDAALLRAGRFDRQIHVELPDLSERQEIFKVHLRPLRLDPNFDAVFLAKQTPGFSGADIANVCNEAALIAARKGREFVSRKDFLDGIDRIVGGLERKTKILTPEERRKVAFHESGHAVVSWLLEHASPLLKVSIIPRGRSLGAAWYVPEERQLNTTDQMFEEMCALLGGRAAEDVVFGEVSTGALNDLERVNKMAHAMVAFYGMADGLRNRCFYDSSGKTDYSFTKPYSETTAELIDGKVGELVDRAYNRAIEILTEHRAQLEELAERLLSEEVIFACDLEKILGKRRGAGESDCLSAEDFQEPADSVVDKKDC